MTTRNERSRGGSERAADTGRGRPSQPTPSLCSPPVRRGSLEELAALAELCWVAPHFSISNLPRFSSDVIPTARSHWTCSQKLLRNCGPNHMAPLIAETCCCELPPAPKELMNKLLLDILLRLSVHLKASMTTWDHIWRFSLGSLPR